MNQLNNDDQMSVANLPDFMSLPSVDCFNESANSVDCCEETRHKHIENGVKTNSCGKCGCNAEKQIKKED